MLKGLTMGLLGVMIVIGLAFIVAGQYEKTICEDIDGSTYTAGACANGGSEAFNQTVAVKTAMGLLVSFLSIIVLMMIVKLLMNASKSFTDE